MCRIKRIFSLRYAAPPPRHHTTLRISVANGAVSLSCTIYHRVNSLKKKQTCGGAARRIILSFLVVFVFLFYSSRTKNIASGYAYRFFLFSIWLKLFAVLCVIVWSMRDCMIFQMYVCALEAYICLLICSHCIRWRSKFDRIVLDLCVYHTFAIGFYFYYSMVAVIKKVCLSAGDFLIWCTAPPPSRPPKRKHYID